MIVLYPDMTATDYKAQLWDLCEKLKLYIEKRGGEVQLSKKSLTAPDVNPLIIKNTLNPDVFIQVSAGYTDDDDNKYLISGDNYNALAGMLNNQLSIEIEPPKKGSGMSFIGEVNFGTVSDISINIKTLPSDLDVFAKHLVEAAFWYGIKQAKLEEYPGILDPYFYKFEDTTTWQPQTVEFKKGQDISLCSGEMKDDKVDGKDTRCLYITGNFDNKPYYDQETTTEALIPQHYTWKTPITDQETSADTLKLQAKGSGTLYIKVGKTDAVYKETPTEYKVYTETLSSDYTEITFSGLGSIPQESIEIGIQGNGNASITGVWFLKTLTNYKKLPQGVRDDLDPDPKVIPEEPQLAITDAITLEDKAKDQIKKDLPDPEEETAEDPTDGASTSSPEGFGAALEGPLAQLTSASDEAMKTIDLNSIAKLDTSAMTSQIKDKMSMLEKANLSKAKDKLDSLKSGAAQQAKALLKGPADKLKAKQSALSPANLQAAKSKISSLKDKAKIPTAEATAGAAKLKSDMLANADKVKTNALERKNALKVSAADKISAAQSKLAQASALKSQATNAVNAAKAATSGSIADAANKIKGK